MVLSFVTLPLVFIAKEVKASPLPQHSVPPLAQTSNTGFIDQVKTAMETIQQAEKNEDTETMLKFLAPYVITRVTVDRGDTQTSTLLEGMERHGEFIKENFTRIKSREILSNYMTVSLNDGGEVATVTRVRSSEIITEDGNRFLSLSTDKIRFAMVDNQPKIVNIESKGWVEPVSR